MTTRKTYAPPDFGRIARAAAARKRRRAVAGQTWKARALRAEQKLREARDELRRRRCA